MTCCLGILLCCCSLLGGISSSSSHFGVPGQVDGHQLQADDHLLASVPSNYVAPAESGLSEAVQATSQVVLQTRHKKSDSSHSPFEPRFSVSREEVSDDDWRAELAESFSSLLALQQQQHRVLSRAPAGLVNVNYGNRGGRGNSCVHVGTELEAEVSAYRPSAVSFPADKDREHVLLLIDLDNANHIHWLVVNIPGSRVSKGQTIAEYNSPTPSYGQPPHRYLFLVMEQGHHLAPSNLAAFQSRSCQTEGRSGMAGQAGLGEGGGLEAFRQRFSLSEVTAANFFVVRHDSFVDGVVAYCANKL